MENSSMAGRPCGSFADNFMAVFFALWDKYLFQPCKILSERVWQLSFKFLFSGTLKIL